MREIAQLINELCPNGVKSEQIEVLIERNIILLKTAPKKLTKDLYRPFGQIPIIDQGQDFTVGFTDDFTAVIDGGPHVIFGDHTEVFKYIDFNFAQGADGIKILRCDDSQLLARYLFYALESYYQKTGKYTRHFSFLKKTFLPVPPLEVQNEIVRILDNFTQLEAELEAELEARKEQYNYYRNGLLVFDSKVAEWKTLEEVADFKYGFTDKAQNTGDVRFVRITDIDSNGKLAADDKKYVNRSKSNDDYILKRGDLLLARTGATFGKTMLFNENYSAVYASFLIRIRFKDTNVLPAFYWHFAQSSLYWEQAFRLVGGGAQPQFNANVLKLIRLQIPPLPEQERIVSILDKFDALVNDIYTGLPAEIAARRRQYEYYRNQLLTFPSQEA